MAQSDEPIPRKEEIERSMNKLQELIRIRNEQLSYVEKLALQDVANKNYTLLNNRSSGKKINRMIRSRRSLDSILKIHRRGLFLLHQRQRFLEEELKTINADTF